MTDHESHHDELLLGWVEDTLAPEDRARVEAMFAADPDLARTLESMRRHRMLVGRLVDPPVPSDLDAQVERVLARPLLSAPSPGQYRRRNRPPISMSRLRRPALAAAVVVCGLGLLATVVMINPLRLFAPPQSPLIARNPDAMDLFRTDVIGGGGIVGGGSRSGSFGATRSAEVVIDPEPLALVLPLADDDEMLAMLRLLALRTDATLLANASAADLLDPALQASSAGGGSSEPPLLLEVEGVLLGDASLVPTMDDQFVYAGLGAVWTVTITLDRFESFLQVLDEVAASRGELVLLEDHLAPDDEGGWSKTIRARNRWRTWEGATGDTMIEIPVFLAEPTEAD